MREVSASKCKSQGVVGMEWTAVHINNVTQAVLTLSTFCHMLVKRSLDHLVIPQRTHTDPPIRDVTLTGSDEQKVVRKAMNVPEGRK